MSQNPCNEVQLPDFEEFESRLFELSNDWVKYPHAVGPDGLVHRVVRVHSAQLLMQVHDEVTVKYIPITGCGVRLSVPDEETAKHRTPEENGFLPISVTLSCVRCASGLADDGDRERAEMKHRMFGSLYGKPGSVLSGRFSSGQNNISVAVPRASGKNYNLKALAERILGGPLRHRMPAAPSKRPGRRIRQLLAQAVWTLP